MSAIGGASQNYICFLGLGVTAARCRLSGHRNRHRTVGRSAIYALPATGRFPRHRNGAFQHADPGRRIAKAADDRLQQLRPRGRSLRDADLPDRGDRSRGGIRPPLRRAACARHRVVLCLRHLFAAGGLARRPLEPPLHDGGVLYRLRPELCRGGVRAELHRARHRAVRARRVRLDLSSGRHRHRGRCRDQSRADARLQRRLRQYRRLACCRHHRGADRVDRLARRVPGAGRRLRRDRDRLFRAGAGRPQARRRAAAPRPTFGS